MKNLINLLVIIVFTIILSSCEPNLMTCYECNPSQNKQVAHFISSNIEAANNYSDEEMEDVIYELHSSGIKLYCIQKRITQSHIDTKNDSLTIYIYYQLKR